MKVELTPTPPQEKPFEPFSVTFTFETEQEACNMYHRLNAAEKHFKDYSSNSVKLPITFSIALSREWGEFNQIMFERGLSKYKTYGK
jgi:hypothetical protein